ncbi:hypothetical protein [Nocardia seriolae]|uniref:Secreted protein n=1 Tax=Nocardia seriolae TaxID=37332 RepID=A0A0B8NDW0_9NOCA|nr:hypothetical protein [Nocardia seriolae]APA96160.1 hypothetical protein NS506_02093 [Nocardia seriolae]MTJ65763.1 hypothetical protein [Nocardia seriolae]MTJ75130.1 hypothetical protein [Nocardia seriolae]MTJ86304.1 hypothetical protein [Nocardia seriolae]MTK30300.1 hypothetical protein [Nocardia seriolae]
MSVRKIVLSSVVAVPVATAIVLAGAGTASAATVSNDPAPAPVADVQRDPTTGIPVDTLNRMGQDAAIGAGVGYATAPQH